MKINKDRIKRILVITLSNVGDVILTTPVVETLIREFPSSRVDVMVGPRGEDVFKKHPRVSKLMVYDKHVPFSRKIALLFKLRKLKYDLVADLRNTAFPVLLRPLYRTKALRKNRLADMHKKEAHLSRIRDLGLDTANAAFNIPFDAEDEARVNRLLRGIDKNRLVLISPGAKSHTKRWPAGYFAGLCDELQGKFRFTCALIGNEDDRATADDVLARSKIRPLDFTGKTSLNELACLIKRSMLLVSNDSAPLHVASAVNTPCVAIFGPTDDKKYGPRSDKSVVLRNPAAKCAPCGKAQCGYNYECMTGITVERAVKAVTEMMP